MRNKIEKILAESKKKISLTNGSRKQNLRHKSIRKDAINQHASDFTSQVGEKIGKLHNDSVSQHRWIKELNISVLTNNKIVKSCHTILSNSGNRDGISFSRSSSQEDNNESIVLADKITKVTDKATYLGLNCHDFVCETEVNDHLMCQSRNVDLDAVFNRQPNSGEEMGTAPNVLIWWLFNRLYKLMMPHTRKTFLSKK